MKKHYIIGIDEAGRGPWAGPIVASGWMAEASLVPGLLTSLEGLNDSKKLSEGKREKLFADIERMQHRNECQYAFSYRDAERIDLVGIREANRECMQDVILSLLQYIHPEDQVDICIDGCDNYQFDIGEFEYSFAHKSKKGTGKKEVLKNGNTEIHAFQKNIADPILEWQEPRREILFIIHGDSLIPVISAASIIAKVTRDRIMCDFHEDFPHYGFATHKGYGTRKHRDSLLHYGITPIHRKSYAPVKRLISLTSSL